MDEEVYYWDDSLEETEGSAEGFSEDETQNEENQEETPEEVTDPGDLEDRIDDLLEQIGAGQSYGSMGDYFVSAIGCYAFPGEDCFYHFISEEERSGWTAASNGCYVPTWSVEAYEAYLSSGSTEQEYGETDDQEEEQLSPPASQEDISGLGETLQAIYEQDAAYQTAVFTHMEQTDLALEGINAQLTVVSIVLIVLCVFLAILCGKSFADTFFERMRAG